MDIAFYGFTVIGLIVLLLTLLEEQGIHVAKITRPVVTGYGFFLLALGIAHLSTGGAMNSTIIFESAGTSSSTGINALRSVIDGYLISGYANMIIGAFLLGFGHTHKK